MGGQAVRDWTDLTTTDFAALDPDRTVAVLPVAATEQHGPHLPLSTDTDIAQAVLDGARERVFDDVPVLVLPMMPVGYSIEHAAFAGTLSIGADTLTRVLIDLADGVWRAGVRKLVIVNAHGGQPQVLDIASREVRAARPMLVVAANVYRFWRDADPFPDQERAHGIHAGAVETSIMLHLDPDRVRSEAVGQFPSLSERLAEDNEYLNAFGTVCFGWQSQDLNASGAVGDAALASAAIGAALIERAAIQLAGLIGEVAAAPISILRDGPLTDGP